MAQHRYFIYFSIHSSIRSLRDKDAFIVYLRDLFFDFDDYKWKPTKYKNFVEQNELSFYECYTTLIDFYNCYYKFQFYNKGFLIFLRHIEKWNDTDYKYKILIEGKIRNKAICELIQYFKNYKPDYSQEKILKTVYSILHTGFSYSTFRSYYFEDKFECYKWNITS